MHPLLQVAGLFLKLGCIAFGGPAAHIALMEHEIVTRRKWMEISDFLDLIAVTQLIPGPNSTEMVLHCGHRRAGVPGLLVAGLCFILPATLITLFFAHLYRVHGETPHVAHLLNGIKPVVLAMIFWAMFRFGTQTLRRRQGWWISAITVALVLAGVPEPLALLSCGLLSILLNQNAPRRHKLCLPAGTQLLATLPLIATIHVSTALPLLRLGWVFLKTGAILFGSGYVLFAFLEPDLVTRLGWMTRTELLDAIAIGQLTPGPVLSTSTFIGYQIAGGSGALLSTVCIFAPSFVYILLLTPWIPKLRNSPTAAAFLEGAKTSAVALIGLVLIRLASDTLQNPLAWTLFLASVAIIGRWPKLNILWIFLTGGLFGVIFVL